MSECDRDNGRRRRLLPHLLVSGRFGPSIWALGPIDYAVNHRVVDSFNRDANLSSLFFNLQIDSFVAKDM